MDIQQPFVTQEQKVKFWTEAKEEIKQLQADNLKLREALEAIAFQAELRWIDKAVQKALGETK